MIWRSIFDHLKVPKLARKLFLLINDLFETNYSKPLRQPYANLTYRVDLKHRNSILKILFFREKKYRGPDDVLFVVFDLFFVVIEHWEYVRTLSFEK